MMHFTRFYKHFLDCDKFTTEAAKYPSQERCLLLIGVCMRKFDAETQLVAMSTTEGNTVAVIARHRPPFWNLQYARAIADHFGGGDVSAVMRALQEANLRLVVEFSQSALGRSRCVCPPEDFPNVAAFEPNWEAVYDVISTAGYGVSDITQCATNNGSIILRDGYILGLDRAQYKLSEPRCNAEPAISYEDDLCFLREIEARRRTA